ncbi:FixH family protein [Paenibacillus sp. GCM10023252]|uniref:FixH family protein n=1 Tax=Paenibacillus sp. GCM10023252 TaxID=3252649 RepID=UPI003621DD88
MLTRNIRFNWRTVLLLLAAAILCTWAGSFFMRSSQTDAPPKTSHQVGDWRAEWSIGPYPAKVLEANTFTIRMVNSEGKPMQGAVIAGKLDMVGMVCGNVAVELKETSPGVYVGEGVPLMAGTWSASLSVMSQDGTSTTMIRRFKTVH